MGNDEYGDRPSPTFGSFYFENFHVKNGKNNYKNKSKNILKCPYVGGGPGY